MLIPVHCCFFQDLYPVKPILFTTSHRMPRPVGGEEREGGGKEGVRPHPKGHPFYLISAGERNHGSSQQMEVFLKFYRCPALWAG